MSCARCNTVFRDARVGGWSRAEATMRRSGGRQMHGVVNKACLYQSAEKRGRFEEYDFAEVEGVVSGTWAGTHQFSACGEGTVC